MLAVLRVTRESWRLRAGLYLMLGFATVLAIAAVMAVQGFLTPWPNADMAEVSGAVSRPAFENRAVYYLVDSSEQADAVTRAAAMLGAGGERETGLLRYRPVILLVPTLEEEEAARRAIAYANEVRQDQGLPALPVVDLRTK